MKINWSRMKYMPVLILIENFLYGKRKSPTLDAFISYSQEKDCWLGVRHLRDVTELRKKDFWQLQRSDKLLFLISNNSKLLVLNTSKGEFGKLLKWQNVFKIVHTVGSEVIQLCKYMFVLFRGLFVCLYLHWYVLRGVSLRGMKLLLLNFCQGIVCTVKFKERFPILQHLVNPIQVMTEPSNEQQNFEVVRRKRAKAGQKCHLKKLYNLVDDILVTFYTSLESELLCIRDCLVRKTTVVCKLDQGYSW